MKIIDFEKKGNVVRFYLGEDTLENYYGDDWDDVSYEHNAGVVYDQYVAGYADVAFPFGDLVVEPQDTYLGRESGYCKNDMKGRFVPCIVVVPEKVYQDAHSYRDDFEYWVGAKPALRFYFGDQMEPTFVFEKETEV